jgi:hypothetical protein
MKRSVMVMGLVLFLVVVLTAGVHSAQKPITKGGATARSVKRPDFTIEKIYLTKDCRVAVVFKNLGAGWGGDGKWKYDAAKNLKNPGGTFTYVSNLKVSGAAAITAVIDHEHAVAETNEGNNNRQVRLTCKARSKQSGSTKAIDGHEVIELWHAMIAEMFGFEINIVGDDGGSDGGSGGQDGGSGGQDGGLCCIQRCMLLHNNRPGSMNDCRCNLCVPTGQCEDLPGLCPSHN